MSVAKLLGAVSIFATMAGGAGTALAQDTAAVAAPQENSGGIADIIVTATRRDTDLQATPIAVSVVDSALIQQASPRNIGDLSVFVPNFSAATTTTR